MSAHPSTGASFARGRSKQDYATPTALVAAVVERFGPIAWDLAAHPGNAKATCWYGPGGVAEDALTQDWTRIAGNAWLNPPFGNVAPWAFKCAEARGFRWDGRRILLLVPASVGAEWWASHVDGHALAPFLRPRVSFDGVNPFPKDVAICVYGEAPGYECWRWRS